VLNKPSSEQVCKEAHEPYAMHKKIRRRECSFSEEILAMEKQFERFLSPVFYLYRFNFLSMQICDGK